MTTTSKRIYDEAIEQYHTDFWPILVRLEHVLDLTEDERDLLETKVVSSGSALVEALTDPNRSAAAAVDAKRLVGLLWPHQPPEHAGQPAWWRTPLGLLCARALAPGDSARVSHRVAATMLGLAPGTVASMGNRGTLAHHADGGFERSAVFHRLARRIDAAQGPAAIEDPS